MEDNDKGIVMSCLALLTKVEHLFTNQYLGSNGYTSKKKWMYSSNIET